MKGQLETNVFRQCLDNIAENIMTQTSFVMKQAELFPAFNFSMDVYSVSLLEIFLQCFERYYLDVDGALIVICGAFCLVNDVAVVYVNRHEFTVNTAVLICPFVLVDMRKSSVSRNLGVLRQFSSIYCSSDQCTLSIRAHTEKLLPQNSCFSVL